MRISDWISDVCSSDLAAILEAVGEFAPEHVTRLAKLKKGDIASEAERLADGTGWMPAIFKAAGPQAAAQAVTANQEAEAAEADAAVAGEPPQHEALAALPYTPDRWEARREGKACVSTCRSRW